jgi:S1-C subfamily serine protease
MKKRSLITGVAVLALASFALGTATASTHVFAGMGIAPVVTHTVTQGYLGVDIRDITDDRAKVLKLKEVRGAEICMIDHDGPAIKAGLREGDVILQMNGESIEGEEQLRRMLRETPAGRTVSFIFSRDGQQQTISVQLADRDEVERRAWDQHFAVPQPTGEDASIPDPIDDPDSAPVQAAPPTYMGFGFVGPPTLSGSYTGAVLDVLGPQLAQFFGAQPGTGLLIKSIDADSPAARAGLRAGDVVVRVNTQTVSARADWLHAVQNSNGKSIAVTVLRDKHERTVMMTAGAKRHSEILSAPPAWVLAHFRAYTVVRSEDWI